MSRHRFPLHEQGKGFIHHRFWRDFIVMRRLPGFIVCLFCFCLSADLLAAADPDLPACAALAQPGKAPAALTLGLTELVSVPVADYAVKLARLSDSIEVCTEAAPLPRWAPWAKLERGYGWALFLLAFLLVLGACARLTPRKWWAHPSVLNLILLSLPTWLLGMALLLGFHALKGQTVVYDSLLSLRTAQAGQAVWLDPASARALQDELEARGLLLLGAPDRQRALDEVPLPTPEAQLAGKYRVHQPLNLREGPDVMAPRVRVLAKADEVAYLGERKADWWRVRASTGETGWVSSLWLRRTDETKLHRAN